MYVCITYIYIQTEMREGDGSWAGLRLRVLTYASHACIPPNARATSLLPDLDVDGIRSAPPTNSVA